MHAALQIIELGRFEIDTWYYSPYPEPFASQQKLFLCEFCLKYFRKRKTLLRHLARCDPLHPPGDEIYRCACCLLFPFTPTLGLTARNARRTSS